VLTAALFTLPFTSPVQAAGTSVSQGSSASVSQAKLEQMLAPIALYPDSLLTHVLIASTYPLEIVQAQRWLSQRSTLSVDKIMQQAEDQDWDPSVKALLAFPTLLKKMSDDLDWTQGLGEAFLADEAQVMNGIQSLRQQADSANNLADMDNMTISRTNNQIIIEPVQREIVYVPYYDPRVVYGRWRWNSYPPVYWEFGGYVGYPYRPHSGHFYWTPGIHISFNYFFSNFHWHSHRVVVIDHRHSHRYRPRERYSVSHGAQPWKHKPEHRRGVVYRNPVVKQRYHSEHKYRGKESYSSGSGQHFTSQNAKSKAHQDSRNNRQDNKSRDSKDWNNKDAHKYNSRERDNRAPTYQNTQAELKERRSAHVVPAPMTKERKEGQARPIQTHDMPQKPHSTRELQRMDKPRQSAPRQREEVKVRQSEPRQKQSMPATRAADHNQGRATHSQERRNRD
jgi:hypothetical protein